MTFLLPATLFVGAIFSGEPIPDVIRSPSKTYKVTGVLGEGVFGKVYSAKDTEGTLYAIKCYKNISDNREFYSDSKREYEIGRLLNHPNIIRSYDYFTINSKGKKDRYLVLQHVDGKQLYKYPKRFMTLKKAFTAIDRVLSAFIHAYTHDCIYLDLHFGNLMLNQNHEIMIIDLASFFTFDEVHQFFRTHVVKKGPGENEKYVQPKKLDYFFSKNPELFEKMKTVFHEYDDSESVLMKRKANDRLMLSYLTYYLDNITNTCAQLLVKSDMSRSDRMELRTNFKRLSWNYEEDVADQIDRPFVHCLTELRQMNKEIVNKTLK